METEVLRNIGLTENEIKIYISLLKSGSSTAYEIGKKTGIYRVHVYDKIEQLMDKGLVTQVYKGAKKYFQPTHPTKLKQYIEDKKKQIEKQEKDVESIIPKLEAFTNLPREDTVVEVFKGREGLKYCLRDTVRSLKDKHKNEKCIYIMGIDDKKYNENLPIFMKQYFRDLRKYKIPEKVITVKKKGVFLFSKKTAPGTTYRYLEEKQFNPTNTFVYANKVVIVSWGTPVTAIMIKNEEIAKTHKNHFEHLWKIASTNL